jgi:hypothetical protein
MTFHNDIMNIRCVRKQGYSEVYNAGYSFGHRDARHTAAELAIEADRIAQEHADAIRCLRQIIGDMPAKRDWFDPSIEKIAKELIASHMKRSGEIL